MIIFKFGSSHYHYDKKNADWLEKVLKENGPIPKLVTVWIQGIPLELVFPGLCLRSSLSTNTCVSNNHQVFPSVALSFQSQIFAKMLVHGLLLTIPMSKLILIVILFYKQFYNFLCYVLWENGKKRWMMVVVKRIDHITHSNSTSYSLESVSRWHPS